MVAPWAGIAVPVVAGLALLAGLAAWHARWGLQAETLRKLLHMGIGLIALSFPWLFQDVWPVLVVVGTALLVLAATRLPLEPVRRLRGVLDGVARQSAGDVSFLAAVAILFALAGGDGLLFGVPLLVLTFADSAAALVGVRFGRIHYAVPSGGKSVEGSAAFFAVAFLCTLGGLLLAAVHPLQGALVVAAILAAMTTLVEAASRKGLDNLLVPLTAFGGLVGLS